MWHLLIENMTKLAFKASPFRLKVRKPLCMSPVLSFTSSYLLLGPRVERQLKSVEI